MSIVLVVGAPSGAGKTTLLHLLMERQSSLRFSVSHTTRARREGETDGVDYHFVTPEQFEREVGTGGFLEWAEVYGNRYGTHRSEVERAKEDGVDLLLDLDFQGARAVRETVSGAVFVLITPPSWAELENRLRARGTDDDAVIEQRLAAAREQVEAHDAYDYLLLNDELERAYAVLASILDASRHRIGEQREAIRRLLDRGAV